MALLYVLPLLWYGLRLLGGNMPANLPLPLLLVWFVMPPLWLLAVVLIGWSERAAIGRNPLPFFGAIALAVLPLALLFF